MMIDRPFDYLNELKNCYVKVLTTNKELSGVLKAFDMHLNIVLVIDNEYNFLPGNQIILITPYKVKQKKLK